MPDLIRHPCHFAIAPLRGRTYWLTIGKYLSLSPRLRTFHELRVNDRDRAGVYILHIARTGRLIPKLDEAAKAEVGYAIPAPTVSPHTAPTTRNQHDK
jgi:hypothetical protein